MSKPVPKGRTEAQSDRNPKRSQQEIAQAVEHIDNTLNKLRERIIPPQPYLLSVPSDVPYRHSPRFVNTWYVGTPFLAREEQLQYSSFLSHQGEDESLLRVVGGWADSHGNFIEDETSPPPASPSGRDTPSEQMSRKKISLKDWKSKDKTQPATPTPVSSSQGSKKQVMKSESKESAVAIENERKDSKLTNKLVVKQEKRDGVKTDAVKSGPRQPSTSLTESRQQDLPSPRKKRRLSSESTKKEDLPIKSEKKREPDESKDLPLLLSPTLPTQRKEPGRRGLPILLTPDLPPALERAVADADAKQKSETGSAPRTDPVRSILGSALGTSAGKRPPEKQSTESNGGRVRSDSQASTKQLVSTPKVQSPMVKPLVKTEPRPTTPLQNGVTASPTPRPYIALRYGRKNGIAVKRILRLPPRPKKVQPAASELMARPLDNRPSSTQPATDLKKPDRKRPAENPSDQSVKKTKQVEASDRPTASKTPAAKPKQELATPKKELKSSAMRRIESQEGGDARTPQGDRGRTSTPIGGTATIQAKASPGPATSVSREERAAWHEMDTKYFALGRTLKHEGTALGPSAGGDRGEKGKSLSVVLLIEALLCFMVNHTAQSQARPAVDPDWANILPYHKFVLNASRNYPHLHGLVIQLGAVCRQSLHHWEIERLARDPLPFEHCESAPTPGSDGNTRTNDDVEKSKKRYVNFRDKLVQNARDLQSAWLEGSRGLSLITIERDYPKTWARRRKDTSKRGLEKAKPNAIGREFFIPLDINSTIFEATRFTLSFLEEWSDKGKVDWKPRIEL